MRLIDADELYGKIADLRCGLNSYNDYNIGIDDAEREVDHAPTVEAVPIPCKVGDEVWCVRDTRVYNKPVKGVVTEIYFRDNMGYVHRCSPPVPGQMGREGVCNGTGSASGD